MKRVIHSINRLLVIVIVFALVAALLLIINIAQNGPSVWNQEKMEDILGVPAQDATVADIRKLGKSGVMQLFLAATAPPLKSMAGEYRARVIKVGILGLPFEYSTRYLFGPGRWTGKAFYPSNTEEGRGYNLFSATGKDGQKTVYRTRRMKTYIAISNIDKNKDSFHLDYSAYNRGPIGTLHGEIRKINDDIYLGMEYSSLAGGALNPLPFVVLGPSTGWVGTSEEE
ncbi:MAG: hypothetical protein ABSB79_15330 [Syntrophales bacterium]